jgi:hypothetical protein
LFLIGAENLIARCKENMAPKFKMKDIDMMHYFLGLEVWQKPWVIFLRKGKYAVEILKRFQMEDCKLMATPMITNPRKVKPLDSDLVDRALYKQLIGSLMYLVNTRSNICFAVNNLSQFSVEPRKEHWVIEKKCANIFEGHNGVWSEISWRW